MELICRDYVLAEIEYMKSAFRKENAEQFTVAILILGALESAIRTMPAVERIEDDE